ncbi:adenylate/guanylate cyclase catalytic domain protein [Necator americanus]|uniref:guanylate cyclase n=1 Tax=Necator americanus TaxID=51031 RepID=W2T809_NECAM|nr:adenylate/guanylate cyclase catalytic domain protein [Necator americanus]ETN78023.1 adenylate/guanylate cyclase catalytic domain protein [Necator americanus]
MKELTEEKKKSDILLYRMLPKQVAEKLKLGQSVEPETFDCVTLFFSDVVSFTTLASRCTPLQVVNLLNDLYTVFDAIIDEHDVYKVETIGDGYLCVSGLPHRNGNEHAKEIAEMSFSLLRAIRVFRVPHLPDEKINIRVGLHTAGRVHISTDTMKFLTEKVGGYKTELRGEVIVKGKGAVETYWLLTPEEQESGLEE